VVARAVQFDERLGSGLEFELGEENLVSRRRKLILTAHFRRRMAAESDWATAAQADRR